MRRNPLVAVCLFVLGSLLASPLSAQYGNYDQPPGNRQPFPLEARKPLGVYAHFDIEDLIAAYTGAAADLHSYLRTLYKSLLADPAVSGLTVGQHWDHIQLSDPSCFFDHSCAVGPDGYDWSYLDDAFAEANAAHKSVQLIITPGVDAPTWLLAKIPPCDTLFPLGQGTAPADCGTFMFVGFPEEGRSDNPNPVFPLPWNDLYKAAWWDFLAHLNVRYHDNPALIAVEIGGPNGASVEIILPTTANETQTQVDGLGADDVWSALIQHSFPNVSSYQNSDQVFIDQWDQTIDAYERIFSGVTLILSPDAGDDLPAFKKQNPVVPPPNSDLSLFNQDCSDAIAGTRDDLRSCEAKTEIIGYFLATPGLNAKSTEVGGMTASSSVTAGDIGLPGIKLLTLLWPPPYSILGGAQFDHQVANLMDGEGCTPAEGSPCNVTVEEAGYNVLGVFFYGTPAAPFYGGTAGLAHIEYLDVPPQDIQYAQANLCPNPPSLTLGNTSLQDLLNRVSHDLFEMAGQFALLPPHTCP